MSKTDRNEIPRPVRVVFPAQVDFAGEKFLIEEFTANLSVGGVFLPTQHMVPPGTRGTLTFRVSQWEQPFTVQAEVVRTVSPGEGTRSQQSGLGISFVDLSDIDRRRLQRLVDGVRDGSVVQAIRRSIREGGRNLDQELRRRPMDQKLILATNAEGQEIDALIRDGNPVVMPRLLDNPRLKVPHLRTILRDPRMTATLLLAVKKRQAWMSDEEIRYLFCRHPRAPFNDVEELLPQLPPVRLQQLVRDPNLRPQVRDKVKGLQKRGPRRT